MRNKKGLSAVVATVLIILLTVVAVGMIAAWAFSYISNARVSAERDQLKKDLCDSAGISAEDFCWASIDVQTLEGETTRSEPYLKFVANSVNPSVNISGFVIFLDYAGRSKAIPSSAFSQVQGFAMSYISTDVIENKADLQKIRVQPKMESQSGVIVCNEIEYSAISGEIKDCE